MHACRLFTEDRVDNLSQALSFAAEITAFTCPVFQNNTNEQPAARFVVVDPLLKGSEIYNPPMPDLVWHESNPIEYRTLPGGQSGAGWNW